jgi:hypothetical protein
MKIKKKTLNKTSSGTNNEKTAAKIEAGMKQMQQSRQRITTKEAFKKYYSKIILYGFILFAYILGGAGVFYAIERENLAPDSYMTAVYWAVVTVNTVYRTKYVTDCRPRD